VLMDYTRMKLDKEFYAVKQRFKELCNGRLVDGKLKGYAKIETNCGSLKNDNGHIADSSVFRL
jgi:hypothetical protein